jgi:hypothetical protein
MGKNRRKGKVRNKSKIDIEVKWGGRRIKKANEKEKG